MLKYETCNRLKDAGFPQDTLMAWCDSPDVWGQAGTPQPNCYPAMVAYEEGFRVIAACPNSDELIAEIHEDFLLITYFLEDVRRYRVLGDDRLGYIASRTSPAEALAELYIAIKEADNGTT